METANKMHLLVTTVSRRVAAQYFVEREIPFIVSYGVNPMGEQVIIFTVEADSFNDICEFNDMILEVQGYLASYDVTPFIHLQS